MQNNQTEKFTPMRLARRKPLSCTECKRRKVKCSKTIPCTRCTNRNEADICQREVVVLTKKPRAKKTHLAPSTINSLIADDDIQSYKNSVQYLTHGISKLDNLLNLKGVPNNTNWVNFDKDLSELVSKLTKSSSNQICLFSAKYATFIHQGIVPELFMIDHDNFWDHYANEDRNCLLYTKQNRLLELSCRDYYFWMSLYYINICIGVYFGHSVLSESPDFCYSEDDLKLIPQLFFNASLDCLLKAEFLKTPDIRSLQIYCCMSVCFHAFGKTQLDSFMLKIVVGLGRIMKLDSIEEVESDYLVVDYPKEVGKRLWFTICIIDWLTSAETLRKVNITKDSFVFPKLITNDQLLGMYPLNRNEIENCNRSVSDLVIDLKCFPTCIYQRMMYELAKLKKASWENHVSFRSLNHYFVEFSNLRTKYLQIFEQEIGVNHPNFESEYAKTMEPLNYAYSKLLLLSSLNEELLDIGRRLLPIVGREEWERKYRYKCLCLATQQLRNGKLSVSSYFHSHWIVIHHIITSCMFLLIDMLTFHDNLTEFSDPVYNSKYKLDLVEQVLPTISKLESTHFTAKVGLSVIKKMHQLVGAVKIHEESVTNGRSRIESLQVEQISLRNFLKELRIVYRGPINSKQSFGESLDIPSVGRSQYLRAKCKPLAVVEENYCDEPMMNSSINTLKRGGTILDENSCDILDEAGWREFLDFFYGDQFQFADYIQQKPF